MADCHVLVESKYSQFGEEKPLYFERSKNASPDRFAQYRDKILHVVVNDKPDGVGCDLGWKHEWHVRDAILRGLESAKMQTCGRLGGRKLQDEDILIISDADEVPRSSVVKKVKRNWPAGKSCHQYSTSTYDQCEHIFRFRQSPVTFSHIVFLQALPVLSASKCGGRFMASTG